MERNLKIDYILINLQLADGLTKALQNNAFKTFVDRIGLVDIEERLKERKLKGVD